MRLTNKGISTQIDNSIKPVVLGVGEHCSLWLASVLCYIPWIYIQYITYSITIKQK